MTTKNSPHIWYDDGRLQIFDIRHLLPKHDKKRYRVKPDRKIKKVIVHQTAGHAYEGLEGPRGTALWHVNGRNWPGVAYHFYVPYWHPNEAAHRGWLPELPPDIVYLCNHPDTRCYHTKYHNAHGIGVVCQGRFATRHDPKVQPYDEQPTIHLPLTQFAAVRKLWAFLKKRYGLPKTALTGHSLVWPGRKVSCPGDFLEGWIRGVRG
jgi:hypothetical protein